MNRRRLLLTNSTIDCIDLGLPSGTLWAKCNIGAMNETEHGLYFSWGNVDGHSYGEGYDFDNYSNTSGNLLTGNIMHNSLEDAAYAYLGSKFRIPTITETKELLNNTNKSWVTNFNGSGMNGVKCTSKTNSEKYIFLPAGGRYSGTTMGYYNSWGRYWTSNLNYSSNNSYSMTLESGDFNCCYNATLRKFGFNIRPVYDETDETPYVDLGLPSGTLWAKYNVGARYETEYGNFYMYGMGSRTYHSSDSIYGGTENPLASSADTATQVMGSSWKTPTLAQFNELKNSTNSQWVSNFNGSGVNGWKCVSKSDSSKYIFFPANGRMASSSIGSQGTVGTYWTSAPNGSSSAYFYDMESGNVREYSNTRSRGYGVRGVKS